MYIPHVYRYIANGVIFIKNIFYFYNIYIIYYLHIFCNIYAIYDPIYFFAKNVLKKVVIFAEKKCFKIPVRYGKSDALFFSAKITI